MVVNISLNLGEEASSLVEARNHNYDIWSSHGRRFSDGQLLYLRSYVGRM